MSHCTPRVRSSLLAWIPLALVLALAGPAQVASQPASAASQAASATAAPAVVKDKASAPKDSATTVKAEEAVDNEAKPVKGKPADPLSPENRVWIVMAVMALMGGLFYVLFQWQHQIEQSGYFAGIYTDAVKNVDIIRLAGPANDKWARADYLKEIFLQRSPRGRDWVKVSGNELPSTTELRAMASELDSRAVYRVEDAERVLHTVPIVQEVRSRNPFADDWGGSRTGMLGPSGSGLRPGGSELTQELANKELAFSRKLETFKSEAAAWVRNAMAQAWDWYQEDVAEAERKAQASAGLALSVDFSALRGRGPEFVLEFTAVVVIIFAAVILGVLERLSSEQIGTLLAAIAGYVLGKGSSRARTPAPGEAGAAGRADQGASPDQNAGPGAQGRQSAAVVPKGGAAS